MCMVHQDIVDELPAMISIACFVPLIKNYVVEIESKSYAVTINQQLGQPSQHCLRINTTIHKSY